MKTLIFPVEIKGFTGSTPSSGKSNLFGICVQNLVKFYEVILRIMAKLYGLGMIVCRMNRIAITPVKINSSGNEGGII